MARKLSAAYKRLLFSARCGGETPTLHDYWDERTVIDPSLTATTAWKRMHAPAIIRDWMDATLTVYCASSRSSVSALLLTA